MVVSSKASPFLKITKTIMVQKHIFSFYFFFVFVFFFFNSLLLHVFHSKGLNSLSGSTASFFRPTFARDRSARVLEDHSWDRRSTRSPCSHLLLLSHTSNKSLSPPQTRFSHIQGVLQRSPPSPALPNPPQPSHSHIARHSAYQPRISLWLRRGNGGICSWISRITFSGARVPFHARVVRIPAVFFGEDSLAQTELRAERFRGVRI